MQKRGHSTRFPEFHEVTSLVPPDLLLNRQAFGIKVAFRLTLDQKRYATSLILSRLQWYRA